MRYHNTVSDVADDYSGDLAGERRRHPIIDAATQYDLVWFQESDLRYELHGRPLARTKGYLPSVSHCRSLA